MGQRSGVALALLLSAQALFLYGSNGDSIGSPGKPGPRPSATSKMELPGGQECAPVTEVGSVAELAALAPKGWAERDEGREAGARTTITSDITAKSALTVTVSDLVPKGNPLAGHAAVEVRDVVAGLRSERRGLVNISAGAIFRVRFAMSHLAPLGLRPEVVFEAPCRAACATGERRCAADGICYSGRVYCRECDKGPPERCACVARDGSDEPDGTPCEFAFAGTDLGERGTCSAGTCR